MIFIKLLDVGYKYNFIEKLKTQLIADNIIYCGKRCILRHKYIENK